MSWMDPPPLVKKPLSPQLSLPRIPRQRLVFAFSVFLWLVVFQAGYFLFLFMRWVLFRGVSFWLPFGLFWWALGTLVSLVFGIQMAMRVTAYIAYKQKLDKQPESR